MAKESSDVTFTENPKEEEGEANSNPKPHSNRVPALSIQANTTIVAPTPLSPLTTAFSTSSTTELASATPASPTSTTSPTTPFSPVSATSAISANSAQSPISPTSPPPPLKPVRSPLRPMARSISNGSTSVLNMSPKPFPPSQAGTPAPNPISARGSSSSRTFSTASTPALPHSVSTPNVSSPSIRPNRPRRPATPPPIDVSHIEDFSVVNSLIDDLEASVNPLNRHLSPSLLRRNTDGSYLLGPNDHVASGEGIGDKRKQRRLGQHLDATQFISHREGVDDLAESPISIQFDRDVDYPEIEDEDDLSDELEQRHRSIEAALRPAFSRNQSTLSTSSNISHGSSKSLDLKNRDGPLPPTTSTTTLATVATVATSGTITTVTRTKRISVSSAAPSTTPSTQTNGSGSSTAPTTASASTMTRRQHALHELLSSERAYASDLALVREVHIPLALGQSISLTHSIPPSSSGASTSTSGGIPPTPPLLPSSVSSGSSSGSSSSGNSTRTVSVVSSSSGSESLLSIGSAVSNPHTQAQQLPMTPDDVRIIFSNLEEVALFSDQFCDLLEQALGSAITLPSSEDNQDGTREDSVGQLFLEVIPEMEKSYKFYIHKHPTALGHLHALTSGSPANATSPNPSSASTVLTSLNPSSSGSPSSTGTGPSPALLTYLQTTSAIASQHSHAWDLPSLLIKPVQRFLKYPLLLQAILDETEDGHSDKDRLKLAKMKMEECARGVNESRRRAEVVREVLMGKSSAVGGVKGVALSAGVNLGKMKTLKVGGGKRTSAGAGKEKDGNGASGPGMPMLLPSSSAMGSAAVDDSDAAGSAEAKQVEVLKAELKRVEAFAQTFAKNVVDWAKMMGNMIRALRVWSVAFGKVIGLTITPFNPTGTQASGGSGPGSGASSIFNDGTSSMNGSQGEGQSSEAFDAFLAVIEGQLNPLSTRLETQVNDKVLKDIARLLATMNQPLKLIASMDAQAPFHQHLLTMTIGPKSRPSPALLAASQNYLALRGQLAAELPTYIKLLHRGLGASILKLAEVQGEFWGEVKARWSDLWDMLRVEGEMNAGHEETVRVWQGRWADVDVVLAALGVCHPVAPSSSNPSSKRNTQDPPPKERKHSNASSGQGVGLGGAYVGSQAFVPPMAIAMSPAFAPLLSNYEPPTYAQAYAQIVMAAQATAAPQSPPSSPPISSSPPTPAAANVMGLLGSLDPSHAPSSGISGPLPLQPKPSKGSRPRGTSDVSGKRPSTASMSIGGSSGGGGSSIFSGRGSGGSIRRKTSMESLRSTVASVHTVKASSSTKRNESHTRKKSGEGGFFDFMASLAGQQPQVKDDIQTIRGIPLPAQRSTSHGSSTSSQELLLQEQYEPYYQRQEGGERGRGMLRKPNSLKQKFTDSLRGPVQQQQPRQRSTSKGNQSYFPDDPDAPPLPAPQSPRQNWSLQQQQQQQQQQFYSRPDSWAEKKGKYVCRVIHACKPPNSASYFSYPFFTLMEGDLYEVLQEVGHPCMHPKLPLYVDDGEDCLLLCRDGYRNVGWALASFLEPIELEGW